MDGVFDIVVEDVDNFEVVVVCDEDFNPFPFLFVVIVVVDFKLWLCTFEVFDEEEEEDKDWVIVDEGVVVLDFKVEYFVEDWRVDDLIVFDVVEVVLLVEVVECRPYRPFFLFLEGS